MAESGVTFGTSGARGLADQMTDRVCMAYLLGLLSHLKGSGALTDETPVAIGGDRRASTPRIMRALASGAQHFGQRVVNLGLIPSPAVALYGLEHSAVAVMVTGSHIPADRNGMKFTTQRGEITKADETGILSQTITLPDAFLPDGRLARPVPLGSVDGAARRNYLSRYKKAFPKNCLAGVSLGVYGHSAVGRELLVELYESLGARVTQLGFREEFVSVDTEAIRPEDAALAAEWTAQYSLDAIVSTDGDSDRPLISNERGEFLRGDVAGIITARYFGADAVATPVSCNGALELSGAFSKIERTRIGSPYVIEGMETLAQQGAQAVVGYEANGGFLHQSPLAVPSGGTLAPLPTRDPVIVHLAVLLDARQRGVPISALEDTLPRRSTASGRDESFDPERSRALLQHLGHLDNAALAEAMELGEIASRNEIDGLRIFFDSQEVVHLRPSGNAPELRCYAEAETKERAEQLVEHGLRQARALS